MSTKSIGKTRIAPHGRSLGSSTKKNQGSSRELLRAMQRHNRRHLGYTNHKGVQVRPCDERIKRNHMMMASVDDRMSGEIVQRAYEIRMAII